MKRFRGSKSIDQLHMDIKIGTSIKLQHLRCMRHPKGMDDGRNTKKITKPTYTKNNLRQDPR